MLFASEVVWRGVKDHEVIELPCSIRGFQRENSLILHRKGNTLGILIVVSAGTKEIKEIHSSRRRAAVEILEISVLLHAYNGEQQASCGHESGVATLDV